MTTNSVRKLVLLPLCAIVTTASLTACGTAREVDAITYITNTIDVPALTEQDLVDNATAIIDGTVLRSSVVTDAEGLPATDSVLRVEKVYSGEPRTEITVRIPGGTLDSAVYTIANAQDMPLFTAAERITLFLYEPLTHDGYDYQVLGQARGAFTRDDLGILRSQAGDLTFTYANFTQELAEIAKK
jgi:hypothetical protein